MKEEDYFRNLSNRERAIFEGGISMGALYHQFVGTPVNIESCSSLEKAIEESMVSLNKNLIKDACGSMNYTSLEGSMLEVTLTTNVGSDVISTCISYDEELEYPIMYIKE